MLWVFFCHCELSRNLRIFTKRCLDVFDFRMNFCQHLTCPLSRRLQKSSKRVNWKVIKRETGAKVTNGCQWRAKQDLWLIWKPEKHFRTICLKAIFRRLLITDKWQTVSPKRSVSLSDSWDKTGAHLTVQRLIVIMELLDHHLQSVNIYVIVIVFLVRLPLYMPVFMVSPVCDVM